MGDVIPFPPEVDYWGGCRFCRKNDGCLSIGPVHWYVCHRHRVKWCVGENLFSAWRHETETTWAENAVLLAGYVEVKSLNAPRHTYELSPDQAALPIPF